MLVAVIPRDLVQVSQSFARRPFCATDGALAVRNNIAKYGYSLVIEIAPFRGEYGAATAHYCEHVM